MYFKMSFKKNDRVNQAETVNHSTSVVHSPSNRADRNLLSCGEEMVSPLSMERVLERFRRRLCLRVFRAEHALLLKKNASTMNIAHVSMAQIAAPINVRADKVCYPTR